jgi:predicted AAA+ superfamily ATPase
MKRDAIKAMIKWKVSERRKPLLLTGARQVGKTWLMKEFGRANFSETVYIMCEDNKVVEEIFSMSLVPGDLVSALSAYVGKKIDSDTTLLIFDEIQSLPRVLQSLKYFNEEIPELAIVAAGSTLGVSLHTGVSFPVGKVDFMNVYPLTFFEFLSAVGEGMIVDFIYEHDFMQLKAFHEKLLRLHKFYMYIGGMPEVVAEYVASKDLNKVREIQAELLRSYSNDFSKYSSPVTSRKLNLLYQSIPAQIGRRNKKFLYGAVREGARARDFEYQIQWLEDSSLVNKVHAVRKPQLPLKAYESFNSFKLFLHDVGLLGALVDTDSSMIVTESKIYTEFKGALAEQFVAQELVASGQKVYYYSDDASRMEVDFIISGDQGVVPIEVKAGRNLKSVSLCKFIAKYPYQKAVKLSSLPFEPQDSLTNAPIYLASQVRHL